jgi:small-conductance mechanosensitive channel
MEFLLKFLHIAPGSELAKWFALVTAFILISALFYFVLRFFIRTMLTKYINGQGSQQGRNFSSLLLINLKIPLRILFTLLALYWSIEISGIQPKQATLLINTLKTGFIVVFAWSLSRAFQSALQANLILATASAATKRMLQGIVKIFVATIGLLMVLDSLGVSITPLLGSLGVGSLAVALALQDTLSNFFSGLYIMADKPFKVGDFIEIETGTMGQVLEVGWRSTKIQTVGNNIIVVPNSKAASAVLTNYDMKEHSVSVVVAFGVSYSSDLSHVEKVAFNVGKTIMQSLPEGVPTHTPIVQFREFADSSINGVLIVRAKSYYDRLIVQHHVIKNLHASFKQEGIEIPFPQLVLHQAGPPAGGVP